MPLLSAAPSGLPARFERDQVDKTRGAISYFVLAPALGVVLYLIVWIPLGLLLDHWKLPPQAIGRLGVVLLGLSITASCWLAWRDYRRRARESVVVAADAISFDLGRLRKRVPIESIRGVRQRVGLSCFVCELEFDEGNRGRHLRVHPRFATFDELDAALRLALFGRLWQRWQERIEQKEALAVGDSVPLALARSAGGAVLFFCGLLLYVVGLASLFFIGIRYAGWHAMKHGGRVARAGWCGRHGRLIVERHGIRPHGWHAPQVTWRELVECRYDEPGLYLRSSGGECFAISRLGRDYWPAAPWIAEQVERSRSVE